MTLDCKDATHSTTYSILKHPFHVCARVDESTRHDPPKFGKKNPAIGVRRATSSKFGNHEASFPESSSTSDERRFRTSRGGTEPTRRFRTP